MTASSNISTLLGTSVGMRGGGGGGGGAAGANAGAALVEVTSSPFDGALPAMARSSRRDVAASSLLLIMTSSHLLNSFFRLPLYDRGQRMKSLSRHYNAEESVEGCG